MCWLDKTALKQMLTLRDLYGIKNFIETGVFKGINVMYHSYHWMNVFSCDINDEYLSIARKYNMGRDNVIIKKRSSPFFIEEYINNYESNRKSDIIFFFLDAHFYDNKLPKNDRWVIVNELKALKGFKNCVICIHDFDCSGLGHCCYDGRPLGFPLVLDQLKEINKDFYFYVNSRETCSIYTEKTIHSVKEIKVNENVLDMIRNTNSCDRLKYRGFLYCTPTELNLDNFKLRRA